LRVPPPPPSGKTLFLKPKEAGPLAAKKTELSAKLKPSQEGIRINSVRQSASAVVITLEGVQDARKIRENKDVEQLFDVEDQRKSRPQVLIYDVKAAMAPKEIVDGIYKLNFEDSQWSAERFASCMKPKFKVGPKDGPSRNWVL